MSPDAKKTREELIAELAALRAGVEDSLAPSPQPARDPDGERYRQMLDGLPQIIYEVNLDGRFTYTNEYAIKAFGLDASDIDNGLFIEHILHSDSLPRARANIAKALQGGGSQGEEYLGLRKNGSTFPIKVFSQGVFDNGEPVGVRGVVMDITETKRAEEALILSENYYRTIFENTGTAMAIYGHNGVIHSCNTQFGALSGYDIHEIVGQKAWDVFVAPEERERTHRISRQRRADPASAPSDYELTFITKDGGRKQIHLFIQAIPRTEDVVCSLIDVTDRKRAEHALRKSEERYELVVRGANDGIWDWEIETGKVYYSARYKAMLGYVDDEFPDRTDSWLRAVHPADLEYTLTANRACVEGKTPQFEIEYRLRHKDGSYRWILGRGASVRDESGTIYRLAGTHTDITTRKLNERTTQAMYAISKAITTSGNLQALYETIHAILGQVIDATNFFIALHDEPNDRIVFSYFADEKDDYYDISNVSDPKTRSLTVHILRTGKPLFISSADPIDPELVNNIGIVGTPAAVWLGVPLKLKGKTVGAMTVQHYTNPRHYTDADVTFMEAVSEQVALAIERKSNEEELTRLNEELESMVEQRTVELRDKAVELEAANKRLTELDEIKSALVSSISHELRTPLTSIRGFAKLADKDFTRHFLPLSQSPEVEARGRRIRQNLGIIETEGERLTRLINDFLDINRIESGKVLWNDRFLNPCEVVHQATNSLAGALAARPSLALRLDLPKHAPLIHADPDKIQQVLINLLNNACKFTHRGAITVSAKATEATLIITVADTGMGISLEDKPNVFEKFYKARAGDTLITDAKGTGLGLAICKEIVEHYGGSIWVESVPGRGSAFSFSLPSIPGAEAVCK
jgi:PAS domain S-box-containing protein